MKIKFKSVITALAFVLGAAAPLATAQDNNVSVPADTTPANPGKAGKGGGKRVRDQAVQHDKMLVEKLKLTDEQQQKLVALRKEQAAQLKTVKGDRAKMAETLKAGRDQVRALLTPEQQKDFDAIKPEGRAGKGKKSGL